MVPGAVLMHVPPPSPPPPPSRLPKEAPHPPFGRQQAVRGIMPPEGGMHIMPPHMAAFVTSASAFSSLMAPIDPSHSRRRP